MLAGGHVEWIDDADRYLPFSLDPTGDDAGDRRLETRPAVAPLHPAPLMGRRVRQCWVESTQSGESNSMNAGTSNGAARLSDGQPQRRDTYALEAHGQFYIVRNAKPWEGVPDAGGGLPVR